jgi:hypothetical protein
MFFFPTTHLDHAQGTKESSGSLRKILGVIFMLQCGQSVNGVLVSPPSDVDHFLLVAPWWDDCIYVRKISTFNLHVHHMWWMNSCSGYCFMAPSISAWLSCMNYGAAFESHAFEHQRRRQYFACDLYIPMAISVHDVLTKQPTNCIPSKANS